VLLVGVYKGVLAQPLQTNKKLSILSFFNTNQPSRRHSTQRVHTGGSNPSHLLGQVDARLAAASDPTGVRAARPATGVAGDLRRHAGDHHQLDGRWSVPLAWTRGDYMLDCANPELQLHCDDRHGADD
jgi:hypothetical protein